jgi:hypothetical protein
VETPPGGEVRGGGQDPGLAVRIPDATRNGRRSTCHLVMVAARG